MATDLYPTPTRLALLQDIADHKVYEEWYTDEPGDVRIQRSGWVREWVKVTARVREMKDAGWCRTCPKDSDCHVRGVELTDLGRQVLAAADKEK